MIYDGTQHGRPPKNWAALGREAAAALKAPLGQGAWLPPKEGYCYRHGNDWSQCVADHLPYRRRSREEILARDPICFHEPLCWRQLDWRHTDPPPWKCEQSQSFKFIEFGQQKRRGCAVRRRTGLARPPVVGRW